MNFQHITKAVSGFSNRTYLRWKVKEEKAGKDIVGEEFESMRKGFWNSYGLQAQPEVIAGYKADLVIRKNGIIKVIEEDKGHYVDACFLKRWLFNCAEVIQHYLDEGVDEEDIPMFCLCSATNMNKFDVTYKRCIRVFRDPIQKILKEKIIHLRYCKHERIPKNDYYKDNTGGYKLDKRLIQEQLDFASSIAR